MKIQNTDFWLAVIVTSLGWGLRGTIGGGEIGAMIPGAMLGLCLGHILGLARTDVARLTVGSALGFGLGGAETYGQTIGLLRNWETAAWGMLGLSLKGAQWGLSAAVYIWIAQLISAGQLNLKQQSRVLALIFAGQIAGWWFVNHPRLIYFSDPVNKPREEVWFGLILGPVLGCIYLAGKCNRQLLCRYAFYGFLTGALGFGLGALWLLIGLHLPSPFHKGPWWKCMEFSFGGILGAGFYLSRRYLPVTQVPNVVEPHEKLNPGTFAAGFLIVVGALLFQFMTPHRMPFQLLAPALFLLVTIMPVMAWHVCLSLTICGFIYDLLDELQKRELIASFGPLMLVAAILVVVLVEWLTVVKKPKPLFTLLLLGYSGMAVWGFGQIEMGREGFVVPAVFITECFVMTMLVFKAISQEIPLSPSD